MSTYLQYLPAIFRQGDFLGKFLLAFEATLSGVDLNPADVPAGFVPNEGLALPKEIHDEVQASTKKKLVGLEQILDRIDLFFDPQQAPEDFLPWLAQWVATSLREDWDLQTKRDFLTNILSLYQKRGTRAGIEDVLRLSGELAYIDEPAGKPWPHYFEVILFSPQDPTELARRIRRVRAIVDREKPIHTYYGIQIKSPAILINNNPVTNPSFGPGIIVGSNTVLGSELTV